MIFDETDLDEELDYILDHGHQPEAWMKQTDRVVDAWKTEVEHLRQEVRILRQTLSRLAQEVSELDVYYKRLVEAVGEIKE